MTRLFDDAHHKRGVILSNENTYKKTSHISDELIIFLFDISELGFKVIDYYDTEEELSNFIEGIIDPKPIKKVTLIIDAEKAFVQFLDSKYNEIKYKGYPKSKDGLYKEDLDRYAFSITESISFETSKNIFKGHRHQWGNISGPEADLIIVVKDKVDFIKSDYLSNNKKSNP